MRMLYLAIVLGIGAIYYIHTIQTEEPKKVEKGEISEGDFAQEASPSTEDITLIRKYIPDF